MLTINIAILLTNILIKKNSSCTRLLRLRGPQDSGGERWGWSWARQRLLWWRQFYPLKHLLESASLFLQLSFSLLPFNVVWIYSKCPLPWQHLQVKAMLLAASLANDEEGTNHRTRRGMQSPRHPWTDWAWGCPWSTLFSQVFNLFNHTAEAKVNKDPFFLCSLHFITCLPKTDTSSKFVWTAWRYQTYFSSMPWGPASGERALCLLSSSKPTRIWGQLQHCPLDAKWPWPGSRCMTSLPSGLLQIIHHFWKDSYSEMFSVIPPLLLIHAIHKNRILSTSVWRYSLSNQALKTLHGPCLGAKYCLSPASPNG